MKDMATTSSILGLGPSPLQPQPNRVSLKGTQSTILAIKPHHHQYGLSFSSSPSPFPVPFSAGQSSSLTSSSADGYERRTPVIFVGFGSASSSSSPSISPWNALASLTRSSRDGYGRRPISVGVVSASSSLSSPSPSVSPVVSPRNAPASFTRSSRDGYGRGDISAGVVSASSFLSSPSLSLLVSPRNAPTSFTRSPRDGYGRRPIISICAVSKSSSSSSSPSSPSPSVSPRNTPAFYDSRFGVLGAPLFFYAEKMLPVIVSVSPLAGVKWVALAALLLSGGKALVSAVLNPIFLTYASWFFVIWPWPVAVLLGIWASITFAYHSAPGRPKIPEFTQLLLLATALIWTFIVPLAHFNGYVDGWPLLLFAVYFVFFLLTSLVRLRLYGELIPRSIDPKWVISPPFSSQIAFVASVVAGHWMAAYEAPRLVYTWRLGWGSYLAVGVLISALVVHYSSSYYLAKYFDRMSCPKVVVRFGPYRWVRHPIYTSYMLLFAGFCLAIRATWSMAFLLFVCMLYYEQRALLEEQAMVDAFGEQYSAYAEKVTKRFLPYLY